MVRQTRLDPPALRRLALHLREQILELVFRAQSGHLGSVLSQVEILVCLYLNHLHIDPEKPRDPERDRFVLSKGHGGLGLAVLLAELGFFPASELASFGRSGGHLGMHLDHERVPGIEHSTGSLGHGLGVAVGMALGLRLQRLPGRVVCLLSDGECYEGSTWEAALSASAHHLERLVVVIDRNRLTMDGFTEERVPLEPLERKWASFGWRCFSCDGHDISSLDKAFSQALEGGHSSPSVVIAETVKGKGVDFMEGRPEWHYGAIDSADLERALRSVRAGERRRG